VKAVDQNACKRSVAIKVTHFNGYSVDGMSNEERILSMIHCNTEFSTGQR
jgi:hypothetical protein